MEHCTRHARKRDDPISRQSRIGLMGWYIPGDKDVCASGSYQAGRNQSLLSVRLGCSKRVTVSRRSIEAEAIIEVRVFD